MRKMFKGLSIPVVLILVLVLAGCCCPKKKAAKAELPTTEVVQAPEVKETPPPPPVVKEEALENQARKAGALHTIYFDFDKYNLKPPVTEKLDKTADWLSKNSSVKVRIEGHCDERGTNEYNLALGDRRANSALKYLANLGISSNQLSTISYGEEKPADPGHNEDAWAKNRRDEFKVVEK
ncbi:MAG: peptidoglycan-associated lipoprotein Pal [Deltaproteobacteria bacterium]|nr:peptidoglycan-associated lipoprotein Pal [Deltaproteobacteria bacterium]